MKTELSPYKSDAFNAEVCRKTPFKVAKAALIARLAAKKERLWERHPINGRDYTVVCNQLDDARRMQEPRLQDGF